MQIDKGLKMRDKAYRIAMFTLGVVALPFGLAFWLLLWAIHSMVAGFRTCSEMYGDIFAGWWREFYTDPKNVVAKRNNNDCW